MGYFSAFWSSSRWPRAELFQNAPVSYPTMLHSERKCAHFCSEWSIVGYGTWAFWDLWYWSKPVRYICGTRVLYIKVLVLCAESVPIICGLSHRYHTECLLDYNWHVCVSLKIFLLLPFKDDMIYAGSGHHMRTCSNIAFDTAAIGHVINVECTGYVACWPFPRLFFW